MKDFGFDPQGQSALADDSVTGVNCPMSDNPLSEPSKQLPSASDLEQPWPIGEIATREQTFLDSQRQLVSPIRLAYEPDSRDTQAAIASQMSTLETRMGGELSWITEFDPKQRHAEVSITNFIANKDMPDKNAEALAISDLWSAERSKLKLQNDEVALETERQCHHDQLIKQAHLVNIVSEPKDLETLIYSMNFNSLGLPENAPLADFYKATLDAEERDSKLSEQDLSSVHLQTELLRYGLTQSASAKDLEDRKDQFDQIGRVDCKQPSSD
jgi:hypothetical protein